MEYDRKIGKWIIDTDPGVDDAFALIFAIHYLGHDLIALSIAGGNVGIEKCYKNAKKICAISDFHVPVYKGSTFNVTGSTFTAESIHGADGLFDLQHFNEFDTRYNMDTLKKILNEKYPFIDDFSPLKIIELAYKHDDLNLLTIGPLTNLAAAFMIDPNLVNRINRLVIMGGSQTSRGNIAPCPEFNFACDPIAAKIVFDNFKNISVFPWDTCELHKLTPVQMDACIHDNHKSKFCRDCLAKKWEHPEEAGVFADYGAAISAFYPESISKARMVGADIIIDSTPEFNGALVIQDKNNEELEKKQNKVQLVELLHENIFLEFFDRMIR